MLFLGYDRQSAALNDFLIDECDLLKCGRLESSNIHDWELVHDPNSSITVGGLRSPCPNARHSIDLVDRVRSVIYSFDGMFCTEREKK